MHLSVHFQRGTIYKKRKGQQLLRLFRDFLCFRSWQKRAISSDLMPLCHLLLAAFVYYCASDNRLSLLCCCSCRSQRRWCPPPAVVTGMKYQKVNASYTPQSGEVHGTALIFSLFHRVIAWLFNPCLTAWIIRKRDINAFNVCTHSECWLLTRSEKNNEMP